MTQNSKQQFWTDEKGIKIPYNRTSKLERAKERYCSSMLIHAKMLNRDLKAFKESVQKMCDEVYQIAIIDYKASGKTKGNFTFFNFDRTIKIEVSINERIVFDDLMIASAKEIFDTFINEVIDTKVDFIKELINDAFSTTKGGLDSKKVLSLLKYRSKIKNTEFHRALDLIEQSISRPDSRTYFRVWEMNDKGEYKNIDLNFSSI